VEFHGLQVLFELTLDECGFPSGWNTSEERLSCTVFKSDHQRVSPPERIVERHHLLGVEKARYTVCLEGFTFVEGDGLITYGQIVLRHCNDRSVHKADKHPEEHQSGDGVEKKITLLPVQYCPESSRKDKEYTNPGRRFFYDYEPIFLIPDFDVFDNQPSSMVYSCVQ
jgi:hypothetical protein